MSLNLVFRAFIINYAFMVIQCDLAFLRCGAECGDDVYLIGLLG